MTLFGEDLEAGKGVQTPLPALILMEDMQKLRKKHQELKEYIADKEEMERVRKLFLNQVLGATRKVQRVEPRKPTIAVYETEGIEKMRTRPKGPKKYNLLNVLEMMK